MFELSVRGFVVLEDSGGGGRGGEGEGGGGGGGTGGCQER